MTVEYFLLPCLFWITTVGFITIFDQIAKRRLGVSKQGYINLRLPKFIALMISSVTAIVSLYLLRHEYIDLYLSNFLAIPYFSSISYFTVGFFREIKNASDKKQVG